MSPHDRSVSGNAAGDKYWADLFFLSPLYPLAFPALHSLLILDCTDLLVSQVGRAWCRILFIYSQNCEYSFKIIKRRAQVRTDLSELASQFTEMKTDGSLVRLGLDLGVFYRDQLDQYRASHPGTQLGEPGRGQVSPV